MSAWIDHHHQALHKNRTIGIDAQRSSPIRSRPYGKRGNERLNPPGTLLLRPHEPRQSSHDSTQQRH